MSEFFYRRTAKGQDLWQIMKLVKKSTQLKSTRGRGINSMAAMRLSQKFQERWKECPFALIDKVFK